MCCERKQPFREWVLLLSSTNNHLVCEWKILTCIHVPYLDAAVVEAGSQQQLVLAEFKTVPLNIHTAALLFGNRGAKRQPPNNVTAVDGVLSGLTRHQGNVVTVPRQTPGSCAI